MKKILTVLLVVLMAAALFASCAKPADDTKPTTAPVDNPTDAPADPTAVPATDAPVVTDAPTPTPEPTPEPFKDPYAIAIMDYDEAETKSYSFDTIKSNGKILCDGTVTAYRLEIEDTIDGTDGSINEVSMRGWAGFLEEEILKIGYQIDDGPVVFGNFFENTEAAVKGAGGEFAVRFCVNVPVANLTGAQHELKVVAEVESGLYYMNPEANPFALYYDGPAAADHAIDGVISAGEYSAQYTLSKENAQTWTGTDMGDRKINYYLDIRDGALYVGCEVIGCAAGDMPQLNFNPGARIDATPGLFITFKVGDALTVLQHNHKTVLKDDPNAGGVDITSLIENKIVNNDGTYVFEVKLPADLFKVTDVEKADQFELGAEKLYFGMFAVLGGGGYTNQSSAPGSSWNCVDLGIHEYFIK